MSKNIQYGIIAGVALAFTGAIFLLPDNSTARSYSSLSSTPQIDVFAIMVAAKDLPTKEFDGI
jgi:hypothetical protein